MLVLGFGKFVYVVLSKVFLVRRRDVHHKNQKEQKECASEHSSSCYAHDGVSI